MPTEKALNIDMEWFNDNNENMEVDIGFMSRMEIISSVGSLKAKFIDTDPESGKQTVKIISEQPVTPINSDVYEKMLNNIKWSKEISMDEAHSQLEKAFYPFKEVVKKFYT